ncbi:hypothetical protein [Acinetobacter bereziniae]|uniref:hypothetical protein n=1 Tax=Acinetobacter bereziniae TaxID=106648 RepID=UPI00300B6380
MSITSLSFLTDYFVSQLENNSIDLLKSDISVRLVAKKYAIKEEKISKRKLNKLQTKYDYKVNDLFEGFLLSDKLLLENKRISENGVFDANNCNFKKPFKDNINSQLIAIVAIEESTQKVLFVIQDLNGLPYYINGGDIGITWDNGVKKIFQDDLLIPPVRQE